MRKILVLVVLVVSLGACGRRPTEQRLELMLANKLICNNQLASFSFCDEGPVGWDSIVVLKPYCPMEALKPFNNKNYLVTSLLVHDQSADDFNCTLVFLEKGSCVGYSVVSRQIVDLTRLANQKGLNLALITRATCVKQLHRDQGYCGVSMLD